METIAAPSPCPTFWASDGIIYSQKAGQFMPYTWARTPSVAWYDDGRKLVEIDALTTAEIVNVLAAIQAHIQVANGRVYLEKRSLISPIASANILKALLRHQYIGVRKDPKLFYTTSTGQRVYWKLAIYLRSKAHIALAVKA